MPRHTHYKIDDFGCIKISGQDSTKFLQGQITINAQTLSSDTLYLGAVCNPQGRCISLSFIIKKDDDFYFIQAKNTIETTLNHLKKYAVFFKTQIEDISSEFIVVSGFSNNAFSESLKLLLDNTMNNTDSLIQATGHFNEQMLLITLIPTNSLTTNVTIDELQGSSEDWLYQLATHKIPWLEHDTQGEFLPHSLSLPTLNAVDFKKGCFTGQEVIARMQYKGKLKTHLQLFRSEKINDVTLNDKIVSDDKNVADIICFAQNSNGQLALLALTKDNVLNNKNFQLKDKIDPILEIVN